MFLILGIFVEPVFFDYEKSDMEILKRLGFEIHVAAKMKNDDIATQPVNDDGRLDYLGIRKHHIDFSRSLFFNKVLWQISS